MDLRIDGVPEPAGSPKVIRVKGRPFIVWQQGVKWKKIVVKQAAEQLGETPLIPGPVRVECVFYMPKPKKPMFGVPATKPDIDKLLRATLDGLSGLAYEDDARIIELYSRVEYEGSLGVGCQVRVESATTSTGAKWRGGRATL